MRDRRNEVRPSQSPASWGHSAARPDAAPVRRPALRRPAPRGPLRSTPPPSIGPACRPGARPSPRSTPTRPDRRSAARLRAPAAAPPAASAELLRSTPNHAPEGKKEPPQARQRACCLRTTTRPCRDCTSGCVSSFSRYTPSEPQRGQRPARSTRALSANAARSSNATGNAACANVSSWSSKSANVAPFSGIVSSAGITRSNCAVNAAKIRARASWRVFRAGMSASSLKRIHWRGPATGPNPSLSYLKAAAASVTDPQRQGQVARVAVLKEGSSAEFVG